ncbi:MAG: hypothetical protein ACFB02_00695 [Mastigocoleus sp.]
MPILKRILFLLACLLVGFAGVTFFLWQQATYLPSWYTNSSTSKNSLNSEADVSPEIRQKQVLQKLSNSKGEVELNAEEVNSLMLFALSKVGETHKSASPDNSSLTELVKGTNTQIKDGKIFTGLIIDLEGLSDDKLPANEKAGIKKLLKTFPPIQNRSVYLQVQGKPSIKNKKIILDDETRVSLGNITMTVPQLSRRLGITQEKLSKELSQELLKLPVAVQDVEIIGDRLILRGLQNAS